MYSIFLINYCVQKSQQIIQDCSHICRMWEPFFCKVITWKADRCKSSWVKMDPSYSTYLLNQSTHAQPPSCGKQRVHAVGTIFIKLAEPEIISQERT